jgi:dynein heavy chain, axonemal
VTLPAGGLLSMNFHKDLLAMSQEVHCWERMRMNIPYIAMEIQAQREKYRVLRDNVLMVVRDYNKVRNTSRHLCSRHPAQGDC